MNATHTHSQIQPVIEIVERAKTSFREFLLSVTNTTGMSRRAYARYLSMQYHLTKDVQRHFFLAAAHSSLARRKPLRDFLYRFALEEEPHYLVAKDDLENLGETVLPCPLDVNLWQAFFLKQAAERPFVRLGATCVLENLGAGAGGTGRELLAQAPFLNKTNTRFVEIHFHEVLPHGAQIYDALNGVDLSPEEVAHAGYGARVGAVLYLRLASWVFDLDPLLNEFATEDPLS